MGKEVKNISHLCKGKDKVPLGEKVFVLNIVYLH